MAALGHEPDRLEIPILQFVHVVEGGEKAKMSKRRGDFVTLDELIDDDRRRRHALVHGLALARVDDRPRPRAGGQAGRREPGLLRPVRARADRLDPAQRRARAGRARARRASPAAVALNASERELVRQLLAFPGEVREATERRAPHRIAGYALELGQAFAAFYRDSPVLKEPDATLQAFRIALCVASQRTLAAALGLLGVSAPEAM